MKWSWSAKALTMLPLASTLGWSGYVVYKRSDANNPPRGYSFTVGSMDDMVADNLKTGDLILFQRNCAYMQPIDAASCFLINQIESWKSQYNHCGVIYVDRRGDKFVVEETYSGVKCRPYSARILTSLSNDIVVVPLKVQRTQDMQDAATKFLQENVDRPSRFSFNSVLESFLTNGKPSTPGKPVFPAAGLVAEVYQRMGLLPAESTPGYITPSSCTIKDWSQFNRLKLLQAAHFDRRMPIRLL